MAFAALDRRPRGEILVRSEENLPAVFALGLGKGRTCSSRSPPSFGFPIFRARPWARRPLLAIDCMGGQEAVRDDGHAPVRDRPNRRPPRFGKPLSVNEDSAAGFVRYITGLNKFGYIPNVGLFTDDIKPEDGKVIKQAFRRGQGRVLRMLGRTSGISTTGAF